MGVVVPMPRLSVVLFQNRLLLFSLKMVPLKNGMEPVCQVVVPVPPWLTASVPDRFPRAETVAADREAAGGEIEAARRSRSK